MEFSDKTVIRPGNHAESTLAPGQVLGGKYRIDRELGKGGMGVVYLATHVSLQRKVAIKVMPPELAVQEAFVERFRREAKTLASLRHAHIVSVTDFDIDSGHYYLVLDYIDGGTLEDYCREKGGTLRSVEAGRILKEVLSGLAHAHKASIVHRDLKPANIMMEKTGEAKINDFGLARVVGDAYQRSFLERSSSIAHESSTNVYVGTADFMAPEVKMGRQADRRADLYAMGVIIYWMLAGKRPGAMAEPISKVVKSERLTPLWDRLVAKSLVDDPDRRFGSAEEMLQALEAALASTAGTRGFPRWTVPAAGVAAVLLAAGAWYFLRQPPAASSRDERQLVTNPVPAGSSVAAPGTEEMARPSLGRDASVETPVALSYVLTGLPPKARISIGDQRYQADEKGVAKFTLPTGPQRLELEADGYEAKSLQLGLPGSERNLELKMRMLEPRPITLTGLPRGAQVTVGGQAKTADASGALVFNLRPGRLEIRAKAPCYEDLQQTLELKDADRELSFVMKMPKTLGVVLPGNSSPMTFMLVDAKPYQIGSPREEMGRSRTDFDRQTIRIEKPYYVAATELTHSQWEALMKVGAPSTTRGSAKWGVLPVNQVSLSKHILGPQGLLSAMDRLLEQSKLPYKADLPTEHEWEVACRAGTSTAFSNGMDLEQAEKAGALDRIAVLGGRHRDPEVVASREPNAWGLYDMHGNVSEWTYLKRDNRTISYAVRGGDYRLQARACRSSSRTESSDRQLASPGMGVRLVLRPSVE